MKRVVVPGGRPRCPHLFAKSTDDTRTVTNGNFTTRGYEGRRRDRLK